MACSCPEAGPVGSEPGAAGRRGGRRGQWPALPLLVLLALLQVLVSAPSSPAPFQGDPAPGRSPGPPGLPDPSAAAGVNAVGTATPPAAANMSSTRSPKPGATAGTAAVTVGPTGSPTGSPTEPPWCSGYAAMPEAAPAHMLHSVNLSLGHGLFQPSHGLVRGVKYTGKILIAGSAHWAEHGKNVVWDYKGFPGKPC